MRHGSLLLAVLFLAAPARALESLACPAGAQAVTRKAKVGVFESCKRADKQWTGPYRYIRGEDDVYERGVWRDGERSPQWKAADDPAPPPLKPHAKARASAQVGVKAAIDSYFEDRIVDNGLIKDHHQDVICPAGWRKGIDELKNDLLLQACVGPDGKAAGAYQIVNRRSGEIYERGMIENGKLAQKVSKVAKNYVRTGP